MTSARSLFVAVMAAAAFAACGPSEPDCDASNCAGCCTDLGFCDTGSSAVSCGSSGAQCESCTEGDVCAAGICAAPTCAAPDGIFAGPITRTAVVSGASSSPYCPSGGTASLEFDNGAIVSQTQQDPATGEPHTLSATFADAYCSAVVTASSTGCTGDGGVCRSLSVRYELAGVVDGSRLAGTVLLTVAGEAGASCQARYDVTLSR